MYKYWLVKQFTILDIDIINLINQHTRIIQPPYTIQPSPNIVHNNLFLDQNFHTPYNINYDYEKSIVEIKNNQIVNIHFNYFSDPFYDVSYHINFQKSFINPTYIQLYQYETIYYNGIEVDHFSQDGDYIIFDAIFIY